MFSMFKSAPGRRAIEWLCDLGATVQGEPDTAVGEYTPTGGPRDAVIVIDKSGSMADTDWPPSRLLAALAAAKAYVDQLAAQEPEARIAVVAYGCSASVVCRLTPVSKAQSIRRAIDGIEVGGSTNLAAGLKAAARVLARGSNGVKQVVTLSDGHANNSRSAAKAGQQVLAAAIHETIGIGGSPSEVDERLLREIASNAPEGGKRYRFIGDRARLIETFEQLAGCITRN